MGQQLHKSRLINPSTSPERELVLTMDSCFQKILQGPHAQALMQNGDFGILFMELETQKIQPFPNNEDLKQLHAAILRFSQETGIDIIPTELQDFNSCLNIKEPEKDEFKLEEAVQAAADSIIMGELTLQNIQTRFLKRVKEAVLNKLGQQKITEDVLELNGATLKPRVDWDVKVGENGKERRSASGEKIYRQMGREQTFDFLQIPTHEFQNITTQLDKALALIITVTRIEITEAAQVQKITGDTRRRITSKILIHPHIQ